MQLCLPSTLKGGFDFLNIKSKGQTGCKESRTPPDLLYKVKKKKKKTFKSIIPHQEMQIFVELEDRSWGVVDRGLVRHTHFPYKNRSSMYKTEFQQKVQ